MSSTPLWVPLIVAGIGVVGTLLAGLAGAAIANRHATAREARAWGREQQREQERWQREDRERTFEERRRALEDYYDALRSMALQAYNHGMGLGDDESPELPEGWQTEAFHRRLRVELYAERTTSQLAAEAYSAAWTWGHATRYGVDDARFYVRQETYDDAESAFVAALRRELHVATDDE